MVPQTGQVNKSRILLAACAAAFFISLFALRSELVDWLSPKSVADLYGVLHTALLLVVIGVVFEEIELFWDAIKFCGYVWRGEFRSGICKAWEHRWKVTEAFGFAILVAGLAGELAIDPLIETRQRIAEAEAAQQLALQKTATAQANALAASANEEAAQDKLELASLKLPREMTLEKNFDVVGHTYLNGTPFDLSANADIEPMVLAVQVRKALLSIGMIEQSSKTMYHWTPPDGSMPIGTIIRSGVAVRSCSVLEDLNLPTDRSTKIRILGALLSDSGLGTVDNPVTFEPWDPKNCAQPDLIHVEIGSKPTAPWQPPAGTKVIYPKFQVSVPTQR